VTTDSFKPIERAYLLLQAAIAEGALSDISTAYSRVDPLLSLSDDDLLTLVKVCSDFIARTSLRQGHEWTAHPESNIEDRSPPERVFTRRILAAWPVDDPDPDTVEALVRAACADPEQRVTYLTDMFRWTVDWSEMTAERAGNPRTLVWQFTKSIRKEGLRSPTWNG
jgi:hypothetical protein